jgi:hypothetical protein
MAATAAVLLLAQADGAAAQDGTLLRDQRPGDAAALATGEQLLVEGQDGELAFAGRRFAAAGFTGVLGYSSEVAYVAVIAGAVAIDGRSAGAGRMVLLPPLGGKARVERFDAARFAESWPQPAREARPASYAALGRIAGEQRRGVFFGRLGRTRLNVAAPGSADQELAARTVRGGEAVRAIRFAEASAPEQVEQAVAQAFVAALAAGDAERLAALMDPVPFGNTDLRGGASEARLTMARALLARRDWPRLLAGVSLTRDGTGNDWTLAGPLARGVVRLRPMGDFVFVRTIELGGQ